MKLSQQDAAEHGASSTADGNETKVNPCTSREAFEKLPGYPCSAVSNNGACQNIKGSARVPQSFPTAFSLHFAPTYPVTITPIPVQSPLPSTTRSKTSKAGRPSLCHHARYVLDDKPPRSTTVNVNMECTNCGTKNTSAWRRSAEGKSECNACNLFFRKNGRKRPVSMRRDTIARRYRLSRCDLCAIEAQGGQPDFAQFQKSVARQRRNGKSSAKAGAMHSNEVPSQQSATAEQTALGQQAFFVPHPEFSPAFPAFVSTNADYSNRNPVVMGYATERSIFNVTNVEQPASLPDESQFCFARQTGDVLPCPPGESFEQSLLAASVPLEVVKHEALDEGLGTTIENVSPEEIGKPYPPFAKRPQPYDDFPVEQKMMKTEPIHVTPFQSQYNGQYAKEDNPDADFLTCPAPATAAALESRSTGDTPLRRDLNEPFDLFKHEAQTEGEELVFRSL